jgi:hypothetical protein
MCDARQKTETRSKIDQLIESMDRLSVALELANHRSWAAEQRQEPAIYRPGYYAANGGAGGGASGQNNLQPGTVTTVQVAPGQAADAVWGSYSRMLRRLLGEV